MRKIIFSMWLCFALSQFIYGQNKEKKNYTTKYISSNHSLKIDGNINEKDWDSVEWTGDFVQHRPDNGASATQDTRFKILYDDSYIYVAIQCLDSEPELIESRLSRRDGFQGDWVMMCFDSYHDLSTSFTFIVTAAGVKGDEFLSNDGSNSDVNWNPIWYTKTTIDSEGWNAEMKIPFSQLRFTADENQQWGLQVMRKLLRKEERSLWQFVAADAPGWVSNFGKLNGLKNVSPKRQIELQPYTVAKLETHEKQEGNPYRTGIKKGVSAGLDGKIGITNDLTLDFTINPDFGQVEADPAAIALDGFQIFFNEQRPFFIENKNIFDYAVSSSASGGTFGNDNLFYSRRIGKNPSSYPSLAENEYAETPTNTTILGAAKLSGKTKNGWSVGILETLTSNEYAKISGANGERKELVEPLTNYFVSRIAKEFNSRNTSIGGIFTSTNRKLNGQLDFLHKNAFTGGLDFRHFWNDRTWYIEGDFVMSSVYGSKNAITNTQTSIRHLFQRQDATHINVDTSRTNLTGNGGSLRLGKNGGGDFIFQSGFAWRTPELELNDIGFQRVSDDLRHHHWMGYRWRQPFYIFNQLSLNYNHWVVTNFAGNLNAISVNLNCNMIFKNNWSGGTGTNLNPLEYSYSELRGGPRFRKMPNYNGWVWFESDSRKKFRFGGDLFGGTSIRNAEKSFGQNFFISYMPTNALSISINQNYNSNNTEMQYVTQVNHNGKMNYLVSELDQKTLSFSMRINYTINPNLTIQYYGQPFISRGRYSDFKWIGDAYSIDLTQKLNPISSESITLSEDEQSYFIDVLEDGTEIRNIQNPDFSFVQFRSNLVLRWEYKPGSEFYLVWSQGTSGLASPKDGLFKSLDNQILGNTKENIFLMKATYRLIL